MQDVSHDPRQIEVERLVRALYEHVEAGAVPEVLRQLTEQLEKQAAAERRCAELFQSEQLALSEARIKPNAASRWGSLISLKLTPCRT